MHKEFQAPPIPSVGEASGHVDCVRKSPFYAALWQLTPRDRGLTVASNLGYVRSTRPIYILPIKQVKSPELLWP